MPGKPLITLAVAAAVLAAPAMAHARDVVVPVSVAGATTVPAGGAATLSLRCPSPAVALNAAITRSGSAVSLRRSVPGGEVSGWSFRLHARTAPAARRRVRAVLRCVRLAPVRGISGARLMISTRTARNTPVAGGDIASFSLDCGRGWLPTGYAFSPGARSAMRLVAAVPTAHGWVFRVENTGRRPVRPVLSGRCLRRVVRANGGERLAFDVTTREYSRTLAAGGEAGHSRSCSGRRFSLSASAELEGGGTATLTGGYPRGSRGARWAFQDAGAGEEVRSFLVCLDRGSSFR